MRLDRVIEISKENPNLPSDVEKNLDGQKKGYFKSLTDQEKWNLVHNLYEDAYDNVDKAVEEWVNATSTPGMTNASLKKWAKELDSAVKNTEGVAFDKNHPMPKNIREFTESEKAYRRGLYLNYREKVYYNSLVITRSNDIVNKYLRNEMPTGRRLALGLIKPRIGEDPEIATNRFMTLIGDDEKAQAIIYKNILEDFIELHDKLNSKFWSDEELMENFVDKMDQLKIMTEAVKIYEEYKDNKWIDKDTLSRYEYRMKAMENDAALIDKMMFIASPDYAEIDLADLSQCRAALDGAGYESGKEGDEWPVVSAELRNKMVEDEGVPVSYEIFKRNGVDIKSATYEDSAYISTAVQDYVKDIVNDLRDRDPYSKMIDMNGKELNEVEGRQAILDGKIVEVRGADGRFESRIDGNSKLLAGQKLPKVETVDINNASPNDLKKAVQDMVSKVNETTHWYMRSSKEFTEFRKSLNALAKLDFNDVETVKNKMTEVAQKANTYLGFKEQDGTTISDRTVARIAVANLVSATFNESVRVAELDRVSVIETAQNQVDFHSGLATDTDLVKNDEVVEERESQYREPSIIEDEEIDGIDFD